MIILIIDNTAFTRDLVSINVILGHCNIASMLEEYCRNIVTIFIDNIAAIFLQYRIVIWHRWGILRLRQYYQNITRQYSTNPYAILRQHCLGFTMICQFKKSLFFKKILEGTLIVPHFSTFQKIFNSETQVNIKVSEICPHNTWKQLNKILGNFRFQYKTLTFGVFLSR